MCSHGKPKLLHVSVWGHPLLPHPTILPPPASTKSMALVLDWIQLPMLHVNLTFARFLRPWITSPHCASRTTKPVLPPPCVFMSPWLTSMLQKTKNPLPLWFYQRTIVCDSPRRCRTGLSTTALCQLNNKEARISSITMLLFENYFYSILI